MATYSVLYTLLPNGFTSEGRARLSLVASPRPLPGKLGGNPVMHWPDVVAAMGTRFLMLTAGGAPPIEATVDSPRPSAALWASLFSPETPVREPVDALSEPLGDAAESQSYVEELATIEQLYQQAMQTQPDSRMGAQHPVMQRLTGLNAWRSGATGDAAEAVNHPDIQDLLDPKRITRDRVRQAATLLSQRGHQTAAQVVALIPRIRRLALTAAVADNPPSARRAGGPLDAIAPAEEADFAQVIGAVMRHPQLALLLGLRIDLTVPVFAGPRLIRLGRLDGSPLDGPIPLAQPWSAVISLPQARRFVMATQDDPRAEIVNGMLDLRPAAGDASRYVVSDVDVVGVGQQLDIVATALAGDAARASLGLPVRRTAGFTVAQVDRRTRRFQHMLERNGRFEGQLPDEVEGAPVLYADDVTTGYRIDVSADGSAFRSLMRRVATYTIGTGAGQTQHIAHDEAQIEPVVLTQQHDTQDNPHVFVGEEVFGWHGWGFGGAMPGPVVGAETDQEAHVVAVDPAPVPGYPLLVKTEVEPFTLTRLRYGSLYRFRARAADLAGNSIDPAACDPALVTSEAVYHRYEPADPPVIVPPKPYQMGESPNRMVVYSDGDGNPLAPPSQRHLAPPKMAQRTAELHGVFDVAFGVGVGQPVRDHMFDRAKKEEGSWLDPAPGIAVIATDPLNPTPTTLPVPRGEPLAPGEYVIHDTATPVTPYLPDVVSFGPALSGLPGPQSIMALPWNPTGAAWPDRQPARLVLRPGTVATSTSEVQNGRTVVLVDLPPAAEMTVELSSAITGDGLKVMDGPAPGTPAYKSAVTGQVPLLSPRQPITLVHAVRKPTVAPTMSNLTVIVEHPLGTTDIDASAMVHAHAPSTGKVAIEASWTEVVDRGYGPVRFEEHQITVASEIFERGETGTQLTGSVDFGDSKRRVMTFRPVAVTRFQEYFDVPEADQRQLLREGAGQVRNVISRIRPMAPRVHSVVPIIERTVLKGVSDGTKYIQVAHMRKGVRVYLKRPWHDSGEGQMLGVLVAKDDQTSPQAIAGKKSLRDKVTRWATDLYETTTGPTEYLTTSQLVGETLIPPGDPDVRIPGVGDDSHLFGVAGFPVDYDVERGLWFADIQIQGLFGNHDHPFFRFALVAFQPTSFMDGGPPGDLRSSGITITDPIQLTASRTATAWMKDPALPSVQVSMAGFRGNDHASLKARWQTRVFDPGVAPNPAPDICADNPWVSPREIPLGQTTFFQAALLSPLSTASAATRAELRNGRIVVEETRAGWSLLVPTQTHDRAIFTEVFELSELL